MVEVKYKNLRERQQEKEETKARETLKNYSTGKNQGRAQKSIKGAKDLVKNATPWGIATMFFQMKPFSDWMYGLAFIAAILKDLLDITEATGILYGLVFVVTIMCSIFIAMMMLLGSFSHGGGAGRAQQKMLRSWLILLSGTTVELLFGVNFLPIETLTVALVYMLLLASRKNSQQQNNQKFEDGAADDYEEDEYAKAA